MKAILDTHIWLWFLLDSKNLSAKHKSFIRDEANELFLSAISIWEAHLLIEKKRLKVKLPADTWIEQALEKFPIREAPLSFKIARLSRKIDLPHSDPADRFIAATAIECGLTLITVDSVLLKAVEVATL